MPPFLQHHLSDSSPAPQTVAAWFQHVERSHNISIRLDSTISSPSKTNKTLDERCRKYATLLFYKQRSALATVEARLESTPLHDRTTSELCSLLKEEHDQYVREIQGRTPTEPSTSQEQMLVAESIPLRLSQISNLPSTLPDIYEKTSFKLPERPSTPTEPDSDAEYETAPASPSASAALRSASRKRPSPSGNHGHGRRKSSRIETLPHTSPRQGLKSALVSFDSAQFPSHSFRTNNSGFPSFDTEMTIPDLAPSSSALFGPTSSDERAFSRLHRDSIPTRDSAVDDHSSLLYAVSSNMQDAMHRSIVQYETVKLPESSAESDHTMVLEDFRIRTLPSAGFFFEDEQANSHLPFHIQYECARVALETNIAFTHCLEAVPEDYDYHSFWTSMDQLCHTFGKSCYRTPEKVWLSPWADTGLTAKFFLTPKRKSLMKLSLMARDLQKHSRYHKKFGASRFIHAYLPDFRSIENEQGASLLRQRLTEWLMTEKDWLGRQWRALFIEAVKSKDNMNSRQEKFSYRAIFFAVSGRDIMPISLEECIGWFIDIHESKNLQTSFCKIYSRIHLGFSNTQTGYMFHPHQVREVPDIRASDHSEPTRFNDKSASFNWAQSTGSGKTMNDGCSLISLGAVTEVWKNLSQSGPLPSIFQARINGAKGLWIRSADPSTATSDDRRIWIEINESQRKFTAHADDFRGGQSSQGYEPLRWSFEVLSWSRVASPATLHQSFLPVMVDRGVPHQAIEKLIVQSLDDGRSKILQALRDSVTLRSWLAKNGGSSNQLDTSSTCGALPLGFAARAILLLESGFEPRSNQFLAELLYDIFWQYFARVIKAFCVPLAQSTIVKGIADWTGTLKPGEIHLAFSRPFTTNDLEECHFLHGQEVIVTRHPCLRASDIQKVTARYAMELSHVRDVVVFSTLGSEPLANKLQGGDYDGDDYWICWDSTLVFPFRNAPPPISLPDPEELGVEIDRRNLAQVMFAHSIESHIDGFLSASFKFSLQPSLLGLVTDYHERLTYKTNNLHDRGANLLADLHSIIIDSTKNGYTYLKDNFLAWLKRHKIIEGSQRDLASEADSSHLPERAWKLSIDSWETKHRRAREDQAKRLREGRNAATSSKSLPKPKLEHILDHVHFKIISPHVEQTLKHIEQIYDDDHRADPHLIGLYHDLTRGEDYDDAMKQMMDLLRLRLDELWLDWSKNSNSISYEDKMANFQQQFMELQPSIVNDGQINGCSSLIERWMHDNIGFRPTTWTLLKASTLYSRHQKHPAFVWHLAGDILCYIKAQHYPNSRTVVQAQYLNLKAKKVRMREEGDVVGEVVRTEDSAELESYQDDETEFFSISER